MNSDRSDGCDPHLLSGLRIKKICLLNADSTITGNYRPPLRVVYRTLPEATYVGRLSCVRRKERDLK